MVEDKIGRRELLLYALEGIDTEIIAAAKRLDSDREYHADEAVNITELSDVRKIIGEELRMIDKSRKRL